MIHVYRTREGLAIRRPHDDTALRRCPGVAWDELFRSEDPAGLLMEAVDHDGRGAPPDIDDLLPLVVGQEVWAAGVTYYRSRTARMEEAEQAGGGSFYDRIYAAERPELFFKGNARTVVAPGAPIRIRADASWNVPEPELVLAVNAAGRIIGYTAGNDVSSRDIEGENPLYLPQAKVYDGSCSLGPALVIADELPDGSTPIQLTITRADAPVFQGETSLAELKRKPEELVSYLYREQRFPDGAYLMTGTGIVPDDDFTLQSGDTVLIRVGTLPALTNTVA